ncbi:MauE/DoxX family redox-associated membrane protein [Fodinibius sediminis]|uniref:DoxX protein n=1 Tax=Fodinibius sediminis TaxID=1214077 RepID=A0A521F4F9_9BACT|nr:MauE/DoxX family redox-associated membrane protein [Fodinibius sediminis]SMO91055.1 DoxX protein [Fodinibius sediminis]
MKPKHKHTILTTLRILLGLVFLASGIGKLISGSEAQYLVELLATKFYWLIEYSSLIVILTSVAELVIALFLLWGRQLKGALGGALLMLVGFSSVLSYFYLQGMNVENCGCFGALGFASGLEVTLLRNALLITCIIGAGLLIHSAND